MCLAPLNHDLTLSEVPREHQRGNTCLPTLKYNILHLFNADVMLGQHFHHVQENAYLIQVSHGELTKLWIPRRLIHTVGEIELP